MNACQGMGCVVVMLVAASAGAAGDLVTAPKSNIAIQPIAVTPAVAKPVAPPTLTPTLPSPSKLDASIAPIAITARPPGPPVRPAAAGATPVTKAAPATDVDGLAQEVMQRNSQDATRDLQSVMGEVNENNRKKKALRNAAGRHGDFPAVQSIEDARRQAQKDAGADRGAPDMLRSQARDAREAKLDRDNASIQSGMDESARKARTLTDGATASMVTGIVSGAAQAGATNSSKEGARPMLTPLDDPRLGAARPKPATVPAAARNDGKRPDDPPGSTDEHKRAIRDEIGKALEQGNEAARKSKF